MAKRKRLELPTETVLPDLETKTAITSPRARMPIADVAGDVAGRAALEEVARQMTLAEDEGRIVKKLSIEAIQSHHLIRDRMILDEDELESLTASIQERGQQTPIEVVQLPNRTFGLIAGLRRLEALRRIGASHVLALIRSPDSSQAAYQAMVEENEMRVGLSFYERANIACVAVEQGIYADVRAAVKALFAHAPRAKRSKILKFATVREALGSDLRFPTAIPEHLGLALAQAIMTDAAAAPSLVFALRQMTPEDAATERKVLEQALKKPSADTHSREELAPGVTLEVRSGRAVLAGKAVNSDFIDALKAWIGGR